MGGVNLSIRAKILASLCVVIFLMGTTNVVSMLQVLSYSRQYDAIITNITTANSISGSIKPDIDNEMWNIVAGKINFSDGKQYEILDNANTKVRWMMENTDSQRARVKLDLILRTLDTLKEYVDQMGEKVAQNSTAAENEAILEDIRFATSVMEEVVQNYVLYEVNRTEDSTKRCAKASFAGRFFRSSSSSVRLPSPSWQRGGCRVVSILPSRNYMM
jgi:two-component system sensor histidine kinase YesM